MRVPPARRKSLVLVAASLFIACTDRFWCPGSFRSDDRLRINVATGCCQPEETIPRAAEGAPCCTCRTAECGNGWRLNRYSPTSAETSGTARFLESCGPIALHPDEFLVFDYACDREPAR